MRNGHWPAETTRRKSSGGLRSTERVRRVIPPITPVSLLLRLSRNSHDRTTETACQAQSRTDYQRSDRKSRTRTLAITAKKRVGPEGQVRGIDASPEMIARAKKKASKAGVEVLFQDGLAEEQPF